MIIEMLEENQEQLMKELKVECKKEFILDLDTEKLNLKKFMDFDKNGNKIHEFSEDTKRTYYYNNDNMLISIIYSKGDKNSIGSYCYNNDNKLEYVYIDGKKSVTYDRENKIGYYMDETFSFVEMVDIYNNDWLVKKEIKYYQDSEDIIIYKEYDNNKNLILERNHLFTIEYGYDDLNRLIYKKGKEIESQEEFISTSVQYDDNMIIISERSLIFNNESITRIEIKLDNKGLFSEMYIYDKNELKEKAVYKYGFYK